MKGRVTGVPPDARVTIHTRPLDVSTDVEQDGLFTLWDLPSGHNSLWAEGRSQGLGALDSAQVEITVGDENLDNLVLNVMPDFEVAGSVAPKDFLKAVVNKTDGSPKIVLNKLQTSTPPDRLELPINDQGNFNTDKRPDYSLLEPAVYYVTIEGVPQNVYVESVEADRIAESNILDLRSGPPKNLMAIRLGDNGAEVSGVVRDGDGKPVHAKVSLVLDTDYDPVIINHVMTDDNGKYSIAGLAAGRYKLVAASAGEFLGRYEVYAFPPEGTVIYSSVIEQIEVRRGEKVVQDLRTLGKY